MSVIKFLHQYVNQRGISKSQFAASLGLPEDFLDKSDTITLECLRMILNHKDYQDFNYEALLKGEGDAIKHRITNTDDPCARDFIRDIKLKLNANQSGENALNICEAIGLLEQAMEKLDNLSEDYQELEENYLKIQNWLREEFKLKK